MRRSSLLVAVLAALVFASVGEAKTLFVLKGKGNGHGVGLSQWGAYGRAIGYGVSEPKNYRQILGFYYENTTVGEWPAKTIRVLLYDHRTSIRIGSAAPFEVGSKTHDAGYVLATVTSKGRIKVPGIKGSFDSPVKVKPTTTPLTVGWTRYRGTAKLSVSGSRLRALNEVGLESYVKGVVPRESPDEWGAQGAQAALEAQAVAARSYALATGGHCGSGIFCSGVSDQVYGGYDAEAASPHATAAVDATRHEVVLYSGAPAQTFFSSSSGGQTAASVDTWGGDVPYLQSRSDPADLNPANGHRSWQVNYSARDFGQRLGTPTPRDAVVTDRKSGRIHSLKLSAPGWSQTITQLADAWRPDLGTRSSRVWVGAQGIRSDRSQSSCKEAVKLFVLAHGVGSVSAQQMPTSGGSWTTIPLNKVDATHWKATRHPCTSMYYRVVSASAAGPKIKVSVSPNVAFRAEQQTGALVGRVDPVVAGSPVTVERRTRSGWKPVAEATVAPDGSFSAAFRVTEDVYRAWVRPDASSGLVAGHSPRLTVIVP